MQGSKKTAQKSDKKIKLTSLLALLVNIELVDQFMDESEHAFVVQFEDREPEFIQEVKRVQEEPESVVIWNQPMSLDSNHVTVEVL